MEEISKCITSHNLVTRKRPILKMNNFVSSARRAVMLGNSGKLQDAHLRVIFVKRNVTARSWFDSMFTLAVLNLNVLKFNHVMASSKIAITTVSDTSESALSAEVSW